MAFGSQFAHFSLARQLRLGLGLITAICSLLTVYAVSWMFYSSYSGISLVFLFTLCGKPSPRRQPVLQLETSYATFRHTGRVETVV